MSGVKIAGPFPSDLPCLPLLLAWPAVAGLGSACLGMHSDVVIMSFCAVWLFLIDADDILQRGDPDDRTRIVVLLHSKVFPLLLVEAVSGLYSTIVGPSDYIRTFTEQLVSQSLIRNAVLHSWPGPPPAERQRTEALRRRIEAEQRRGILMDRRIEALRQEVEARQQRLEALRQTAEANRRTIEANRQQIEAWRRDTDALQAIRGAVQIDAAF